MRAQGDRFENPARADDVDIHIPLKIGVEGDTRPIRRPVWRARTLAWLRKEFHLIGAVRIAHPDTPDSRAIGHKGNPLAVGGVLCKIFTARGGDESRWGTGGRPRV